MIASGRAGDWERHQCLEISRALKRNTIAGPNTVRKYMPLFPGSMLFNQVAVVGGDCQSGLDQFENPRFQSLDAVYEALSIDADLEAGTLLIDCQSWWEGIEPALQGEIEKYCVQSYGCLNVAVLAGPFTNHVVSICNQLAVNCRIVNPRWWCAASLLCLYRNSKHVVFVDTARSLDAAMTDISCSLVVSDSYANSPVFPALCAALSHVAGCSVYLSGSLVANALPNCAGIAVVENSHGALQAAMGHSCEAAAERGGDDYQHSDPIIRTGVFWQQIWKRKVANINVSTRRKARKLMEDPQAFFRDSRMPGSGVLAAVIPESVQAASPDINDRRAS